MALVAKLKHWVSEPVLKSKARKGTFTMSNLMKGKVFGLSLPKKKTAMAPHLHNVIPKVNSPLNFVCEMVQIIFPGNGEVQDE